LAAAAAAGGTPLAAAPAAAPAPKVIALRLLIDTPRTPYVSDQACA
jgi:hypothetical protein